MSPDLSSRLMLCNDQYQALATKMEELIDHIEHASPLVVRENLETLEGMQTEASRLDELLRARIQEEGIERIPEADLIKRRNLLSKLAELNGLLVCRLEGKISVMGHELDISRKSRRAMNGYRMPGQQRGSMLQRST